MFENFKSYNKSTGMLDDINEARAVGVALALYLAQILRNPILQTILPESTLGESAKIVAESISALRETSQAENYRIAGAIMGLSKKECDEAVKEFGLSETFHKGHPLATPTEEALSNFAERALGMPRKKKAEEPKVKLSPEIENFLKSLEG